MNSSLKRIILGFKIPFLIYLFITLFYFFTNQIESNFLVITNISVLIISIVMFIDQIWESYAKFNNQGNVTRKIKYFLPLISLLAFVIIVDIITLIYYALFKTTILENVIFNYNESIIATVLFKYLIICALHFIYSSSISISRLVINYILIFISIISITMYIYNNVLVILLLILMFAFLSNYVYNKKVKDHDFKTVLLINTSFLMTMFVFSFYTIFISAIYYDTSYLLILNEYKIGLGFIFLLVIVVIIKFTLFKKYQLKKLILTLYLVPLILATLLHQIGDFNTQYNYTNYNKETSILISIGYYGNIDIRDLSKNEVNKLYYELKEKALYKIDEELTLNSDYLDKNNLTKLSVDKSIKNGVSSRFNVLINIDDVTKILKNNGFKILDKSIFTYNDIKNYSEHLITNNIESVKFAKNNFETFMYAESPEIKTILSNDLVRKFNKLEWSISPLRYSDDTLYIDLQKHYVVLDRNNKYKGDITYIYLIKENELNKLIREVKKEVK